MGKFSPLLQNFKMTIAVPKHNRKRYGAVKIAPLQCRNSRVTRKVSTRKPNCPNLSYEMQFGNAVLCSKNI